MPEESQSVIDPKYHSRLLKNIHMYASIAGVPEEYVYTSMQSECDTTEIEYVTNIKKSNYSGLAYIGMGDPQDIHNVYKRMMLIIGACLRNYLDARFIPLKNLIHSLSKGYEVKGSVIVIPNFFIDKTSGGDLSTWDCANLLSFVYQMESSGRQLVIYVQDLGLLESQYGIQFRSLIENNFSKVYL